MDLQSVNMPMSQQARCAALQLSPVGLGALQLSALSQQEVNPLIEKAYGLGVNFIDTAAVYGGVEHSNEALVGRAIKALAAKQDGATFHIATKCGISFSTATGYRADPAIVREEIAASLEALGVDQITVLYLHRIEPGIGMGALSGTLEVLQEYVEAGKVRYLGLSETTEDYIRKIDAFFQERMGRSPLAFVQSAYSIATRRAERNGVLDACRELGIQFVAYTSVIRGLVHPAISQSFTRSEIEQSTHQDLLAKLKDVIELGDYECGVGFMGEDVLKQNLCDILTFQETARELAVEPNQLALAWLQAKGALPIPGTTKEAHLESNCRSASISLTPELVKRLDGLFAGFEGNPNAPGFLDDASL